MLECALPAQAGDADVFDFEVVVEAVTRAFAAQTRQLDLQGVLYGVVEGARLDGWIPVMVRDDSEGLLNPETGVYTPLPTTWLKDQSIERSPFIVAASDTMLLVKYGEIYYTTPIPESKYKRAYLKMCFENHIERYISYYFPLVAYH